MTTTASIECKLDEGAVLKSWVTLCLRGWRYFCLWVSFLLKSGLGWLSETSHDFRWVWLCVFARIDLMGLSNRKCLFSALTRGAFWDSAVIWESNMQDWISVFVCLCVWYGFRCICKHSQQTERWISKLPENGLLWSSASVTFHKIIALCTLILEENPFISMLWDHVEEIRQCVTKICVCLELHGFTC